MKKLYLLIFFASMAFLLAGCPPKETPAPDSLPPEPPCEGAECPSGMGLDLCEAIHAEVNAFLQLRSDDDLTAYVTIMPCFPAAARRTAAAP